MSSSNSGGGGVVDTAASREMKGTAAAAQSLQQQQQQQPLGKKKSNMMHHHGDHPSASSSGSSSTPAPSSPIRLLRRMWTTSSKPGHGRTMSSRSSSVTAMTSLDEDDTASSSFISTSPKTFIRLNSSRDLLPAEIEVVYGDVATVSALEVAAAQEEASSSSLSESMTHGTNERSGSLESEVGGATGFSQRNGSCSKQRRRSSKTPDHALAIGHYEQALVDVSEQRWDAALHQVEQGLQWTSPDDDSTTAATTPLEATAIYWKLVTVQAEVLGRRGDYADSLETYQRVLQHAVESDGNTSPELLSSMSSLYYACGRLAVYLKQYMEALDYYTQELVHTRAISGMTHTLAVARIYHDLARVCKMGLGDWERALGYYEQALQVEVAVWAQAKDALAVLQAVVAESEEEDDEEQESVTAALYRQRQEDLQEVTAQIQETKMCMGRINFGLGRIDEAMRLSRGRFSLN